MTGTELEGLLRPLAPRVLGALVRRYGHFDLAEDAVQEALLAAATRWPGEGVPDDPRAWLVRVASRRLTDLLRSEQARRRREDQALRWALVDQPSAPAADVTRRPDDDTLILLFMCCHPALSPASQIALTLRAVGGLATEEIARAFLVPEATMTRRITRGKQTIRDAGVGFTLPTAEERASRLASVLHVLYLIFNEGYASTTGAELMRVDLTGEALRLTRLLHGVVPDEPEVTGLLALMLLTDARRPARTAADGSLVTMAEQDRALWNRHQVGEGVALLRGVLPRHEPGPYQVQAAIAALHDEAPTAEDTDWPQIVVLYELLMQMSDNPLVALNHAVAVAMARGPQAGLELVARLEGDARISGDHRLHAARGHMLERAGDGLGAAEAFLRAAQSTTSPPMQRYLSAQVARLRRAGGSDESQG